MEGGDTTGGWLTLLPNQEAPLLGLVVVNLPGEQVHLVREVGLLLQLPLAAALRAEAVGLHALVAAVGAAALVAEVVDLRSIVQG